VEINTDFRSLRDLTDRSDLALKLLDWQAEKTIADRALIESLSPAGADAKALLAKHADQRTRLFEFMRREVGEGNYAFIGTLAGIEQAAERSDDPTTVRHLLLGNLEHIILAYLIEFDL